MKREKSLLPEPRKPASKSTLPWKPRIETTEIFRKLTDHNVRKMKDQQWRFENLKATQPEISLYIVDFNYY